VPFGGRGRQIRELNAWLTDPEAPRNLLVTAPAARGKTALLVRWIHQIAQSEWPIVFVPISIRHETNMAPVFYGALAAALANVLDEDLELPAVDAATFYKDKVIEYLDRFSAGRRRCLLVVDGLDEASGWQVNTSFLPANSPESLKVVASARLLANDRGSGDWLDRLGWDARSTRVLEVPPLDREGIADVIQGMGGGMAPLTERAGIVAELERLTLGDPLLIRLYVEELLEEHGSQLDSVAAVVLAHREPDYRGYFKTRLEKQTQAWSAGDDMSVVEAILAVLACALGPIRLVELSQVLRGAYGIRAISQARLLPIRRWVVGDGNESGYAYSHPKLAYYFRDEHFGGGDAIVRARAGIVAWGRATVRALNAHEVTPSAAGGRPPEYEYLLRHYSQHLQQAHEPPSVLMELVSDGWRRAWESFETESAEGFAHDVGTAWQAVRASRSSSHALTEPAWVAAEICCALTLSSLRTVGHSIHVHILKPSLDAGVMSWRQALHYAEIDPFPTERVRKLAATLAHVDGTHRADVLAAALSAARLLPRNDDQARALTALSAYLGEPDRTRTLEEALDIAAAAPEPYAFSNFLGTMAPRLACADHVLLRAREIATSLEHPDARVQALISLAPHLPANERTQALAEGLRITRNELPDSQARAFALVRLGGLHGHGPGRDALLVEALSLLEQDPDRGGFAWATVLTELANAAPDDLVARALDAARIAEDPVQRSEISAALVRRVSEPQQKTLVGELATSTLSLSDANRRSRAMAALAPVLSGALRERALEIVRTIPDPGARAESLAGIAVALPEPDRGRLLTESLETARSVPDARMRATALAVIAAHLPTSARLTALAEAVRAARVIGDEGRRSLTLAELSVGLPEPDRSETIQTVLSTVRDTLSPQGLVRFANYLPEPARTSVIAEAVGLARSKGINASSWELYVLFEHLPEPERKEFLAVASEHRTDDFDRARIRAELARGQSGQARAEAARDVIAMAAATPNAAARVRLLHTIAGRVAEPEHAQLMAAALAAAQRPTLRSASGWPIDDPFLDRALSALIRDLPAPLVDEALEVARAVEPSSGLALAEIAGRLDPPRRSEVVQQAMRASRGLGSPYGGQTVAICAQYLTGEARATALSEVFDRMGKETRDSAFDSLARLRPTLSDIGGEDLLRAAVTAVRDTAAWWP
jgi:hypothetical protein